jgi:uncharacterized protein (DUF2225 family)|tara:strand:+ start:7538 stop:7702 length:165 start_codon:yes stop_codon:yes gene_type:complete
VKLIVCESCEAEYHIKHNMEPRLYKVTFCSFCGYELDETFEFIEEVEDDENDIW